MKRDISYTKDFLHKFFENTLFQWTNDLDSKHLIIPVGNDKNARVKTADKVLSLLERNNKITIKEFRGLQILEDI